MLDCAKLIRQPAIKVVQIEAWTHEVHDKINDWLKANPDAEFLSVDYKHFNGLGEIKITYK